MVSLSNLLQLKCTACFIFESKDAACGWSFTVSQHDDPLRLGSVCCSVPQQLATSSTSVLLLLTITGSDLVAQHEVFDSVATSSCLLLQLVCFSCFCDPQQLDAAGFSALFSFTFSEVVAQHDAFG
jgi:hypothetical protein